MDFAIVQDLDSKQRNWLAEAMVGIITVDGKVDEKTISQLRSLPQVARVNTINFENK